ncbi:MAG: MotA/TolQ/ExbB proton channel family protein [Proteobacteria bacterium]|nr:MAG: MotA/TolQ/ExbB proton channel family protein [Pseudomonadota bacterium]
MDFLALPFTTDFSSIAFSVLAVLFGCSVVVWITLFIKFFSLIRVKYLQSRALKYLESTKRVGELRLLFSKMPKNPLQEMFTMGDRELKRFLKANPESDYDHRRELMDRLERMLEARILMAEKDLNAGQALLATIGVTSPFIGLFGTVIGVINTFLSISELNSVELSVISPGIAEALVATAAGLFAAIPATLGYNLFRATIRGMTETMDYFALQLLHHLQQRLLPKK